MVLPKSKKSVGLGNSLMNDRFGKGKGADMRRGNFTGGIERKGQDGERVSCSSAFIPQNANGISTSRTRRKTPRT
jgi:hypothetical protein